MIKSAYSFKIFDKMDSTVFIKASMPFWKMFLQLKQSFDAETRLKVEVNMADPTSLQKISCTLNYQIFIKFVRFG